MQRGLEFDLRTRSDAFRREIERLIARLELHTKTLAALGAPPEEIASHERKCKSAARDRARSAHAP